MTWHAVHERKCKGTPEVHEKKQKVPTKPKDIHVISDAIGQLGEKSNNKHSYTHPPDVVGINDVVNNAKHFQQISERRKCGSKHSGSESEIDYESKEDKTTNGIDFDNLLPQSTSSHWRHRSNCALPCSGSHYDEEKVLDKDLAGSISMQPEKFRGKVHPSMPSDFDELAARVWALTKA